MLRALVVVVLATLVAGPAAAAPAATRRTAVCNIRAASMTFLAGKAVVTGADGRTLATVTQKRRSVSSFCTSHSRLGIARHLLEANVPRGKRVTCPGPGPQIVVETEVVRQSNGRAIGNRLALWMSGVAGAVAEAVSIGKRSWFSYAKTFCHAG